MSYFALWIDHKHAFVYKFTAEGVEESKFESHLSKTDHEHHDASKWFHEVAGKLNGAEELMIMGPGVAKDEFKHHCEKHHHQNLAKAIVGLKAMESHPTKAMMLKSAHEFFKHLHTFTKNY